MDERDIRIDTYKNSSSLVAMTLVHLPSGQSVNGKGRSYFKLKKKLMKELENKLSPCSSTE